MFLRSSTRHNAVYNEDVKVLLVINATAEESAPTESRLILRASLSDEDLVVRAATRPTVRTSIFCVSMKTVSSFKVFDVNLAV